MKKDEFREEFITMIESDYDEYINDDIKDFKIKMCIFGFIFMIIFIGIIPWITGVFVLTTNTFRWLF